jgi:predicted transcriptional regulator
VTRALVAEEYRQVVRGLVVNRGVSKADVAALLQVSQQRVSQLAP